MVHAVLRSATVRRDSPDLPSGQASTWTEAFLLAQLAPELESQLPAVTHWCGLEPADLAYRFGLSSASAWRLGAAVELGRRAVTASLPIVEPLRGGAEVFALLQPRLAGLHCESFHALYLDAKGRLAHERTISLGTLTRSLVHPREVFAPAVAHRAAAVIVAHNHPSGDPEPSAEDRATTRRLQRAGRLLGIELLDHVVVARGGYVSFLERGWLGSS